MTTELRGYGASYSILGLVRDAVVAELQTRDATPNRISIVPGAIAWDDCTDCGLLALAARSHYYSDKIPIPVTTTDFGDGGMLATEFVVQLIRCAPMPGDTGDAPSVQALDTSAQQVLDDGWSLICATINELRTLKDTYQIVDYMIRALTYVGPEGACVGSELTFVVSVTR